VTAVIKESLWFIIVWNYIQVVWNVCIYLF